MDPLSWEELSALSSLEVDLVNGPTSSRSLLRLFGHLESEVRVVLYRDYHAWCPYCQKVWLWLEEMQIPYRIRKVTMFCYGEKEEWYKRIVPSGMLPALQLDGRLVTESDNILLLLESTFGVVYKSLNDPVVLHLRELERSLFRAWCRWLCHPSSSEDHESAAAEAFRRVLDKVESCLKASPGPFFLEEFSAADIIFTPYIERMLASLFAYKGFNMRQGYPAVDAWFSGMETRSTYLGTQGDFHTHVHDLPPQMGGCYAFPTPTQRQCMQQVNEGPWFGLPDVSPETPEPEGACLEAIRRVVQHYETLLRVNVDHDKTRVDLAIRCVLTHIATGGTLVPPPGSATALTYLKNRISVPRDMSIFAAKYLRTALQATAALDPETSMAIEHSAVAIPVKHRRDQNPAPFHSQTLKMT